MEARICVGCGQPLVKRDGEAPSAFAKRKSCNRQCFNMSRVKAEDTHSRKQIYKSRFGSSRDLDAGQYLAENMMDRNARANGLRLPDRFWEQDQWKQLYALQRTQAYTLLKSYSLEAIIAALRSPKGKKVMSFSAAWFTPLIHAEQERMNRAKELAEQAPPPPPLPAEEVVEEPRKPFVPKQSTASTLKGL